MKDLKKQVAKEIHRLKVERCARMNFHIPEEGEILCSKEDSLFFLLWENMELIEDEIEEFLEEFKTCSSEGWKVESTRLLEGHVQVLRSRIDEIAKNLTKIKKELERTRNLPL